MSSLAKRIIDIVVSALALLLLLPLLVAVWLLVRWRLGSPCLYVQERPGLRGAPFKLIKFRTMSNALDESGNLLPDSARITALGRTLRATSIDELPELWNVLCGSMSLVGPRPLLTEYMGLYSPHQARRHEVRPGITGWAQVNGRNELTWEQRFELDVWYVENWSLSLDFRILGMTILKVLKREGITERGQATMTKFRGNS